MYLTKSDVVESAAAHRIQRLAQMLRCEECGYVSGSLTDKDREFILRYGLPVCCNRTMTLVTRRVADA